MNEWRVIAYSIKIMYRMISITGLWEQWKYFIPNLGAQHSARKWDCIQWLGFEKDVWIQKEISIMHKLRRQIMEDLILMYNLVLTTDDEAVYGTCAILLCAVLLGLTKETKWKI